MHSSLVALLFKLLLIQFNKILLEVADGVMSTVVPQVTKLVLDVEVDPGEVFKVYCTCKIFPPPGSAL